MGLRDQFKATSMAELENQQKEVDAIFSYGGDYLSLEVGKNKVRIFPKHPGEGNLYIYPKGVHFLPIEVDDDKNPGKKKITRKPVWSGQLHSEAGTCIINEYIKKVYELAKEITDKKSREGFTARMTGMNGIGMSRTWPVYANKIKGTVKQFGILELKTSVKDQLNSLAANLDDGSKMITTDPYTDPDTGRAVFITYDDKAEKAADYYKVGIDIFDSTPLTDEELEAFSKLKPLKELYKNTYKRSDFILALEGLKRFDEEKEDYNIFSHPEWSNLVEQFSDLYPEDEESTTNTQSEPKEQAPEVVKKEAPATVVKKADPPKEQEPPKKDLSWLKTPEEMTKEELITYIKAEKLPIMPLPEDTVDEIRALVVRELKIRSLSNKEEVKETPAALQQAEEAPVEDELADDALDFLKGEVGE